MTTHRKTVAVDFDGVIHPYTEGWTGPTPADEPPIPGAITFLCWCQAQGYQIIVFSTRAATPEGYQGIRDWMTEWGLDHLVAEVTHTKPPAVAYVDDRAVPFRGNKGGGDWAAVRRGVEELEGGRQHGKAVTA